MAALIKSNDKIHNMKTDKEKISAAHKAINKFRQRTGDGHVYPLGTKRTSENQLIRIRIKCQHVSCKKRVQGIEGFNGQFYYKNKLVGDLRNLYLSLCRTLFTEIKMEIIPPILILIAISMLGFSGSILVRALSILIALIISGIFIAIIELWDYKPSEGGGQVSFTIDFSKENNE